MNRWLAACALVLVALFARAEDELRIGIEPYFSPQLLITTFQPLASAVQSRLGKPTVLLTAPDYRQFVQRLEHREFDLIIIGPHTARYAQQQAGYVPMLIGRTRLSALIVVRRDGPIQRVEQLANAPIAMPDALTATAMLGEEWLRKQGINAQLHYYAFHNAAAVAVLHDDTAAAVVNKIALAHMPPDLRDGLRIVAETRSLPNMVMLASANLDPATRQREIDAVVAFVNSPEHSNSFAGKLGFAGVDPIKPGDLDPVEPFLIELQRRLKAAP
jgi:phosphonate transport system substrate-binding protein